MPRAESAPATATRGASSRMRANSLELLDSSTLARLHVVHRAIELAAHALRQQAEKVARRQHIDEGALVRQRERR